jgi:hypothetical protein
MSFGRASGIARLPKARSPFRWSMANMPTLAELPVAASCASWYFYLRGASGD